MIESFSDLGDPDLISCGCATVFIASGAKALRGCRIERRKFDGGIPLSNFFPRHNSTAHIYMTALTLGGRLCGCAEQASSLGAVSGDDGRDASGLHSEPYAHLAPTCLSPTLNEISTFAHEHCMLWCASHQLGLVLPKVLARLRAYFSLFALPNLCAIKCKDLNLK